MQETLARGWLVQIVALTLALAGAHARGVIASFHQWLQPLWDVKLQCNIASAALRWALRWVALAVYHLRDVECRAHPSRKMAKSPVGSIAHS
jgi:hypothetical protein